MIRLEENMKPAKPAQAKNRRQAAESPTYRVHLRMESYENGERGRIVYRSLYRMFELPFVPFVGLRITAGDFAYEIQSIEWSTETGEFECGVPFPLSMDIEGLVACGWTQEF